MSNLKCDICGFEFDTYTVKETHYHDYEPYTEYVKYPKNAHLVLNYICDDCYKNLDKIVKQKIIDAGEKYIAELDKRKENALNEYREKIACLDKENSEILDTLNIIKQNKITEIPQDVVDKISCIYHKYPYSIGNYYLKKAIEIKNNEEQI